MNLIFFQFLILLDLPKALWRLAKNPLYICIVVGMSFDVYMSGFYTFLPKYLEKHFLRTPAVASMSAGKYCCEFVVEFTQNSLTPKFLPQLSPVPVLGKGPV